MRIFAIKANMNLRELQQQLLRRPTGAVPTLDRVKDLNPHLDINHLKAGDVLLVPDSPDLKAGAGTVVGSAGLQSLVADIDAGIAATAENIATYLEQLNSDRTAVATALRSTVSKRVVVGGDPGLRKQLQAVDAQFKADEQSATDSQRQLAELRQLAAAEFAKLEKMLG